MSTERGIKTDLSGQYEKHLSSVLTNRDVLSNASVWISEDSKQDFPRFSIEQGM
jgi:hypothetical protein